MCFICSDHPFSLNRKTIKLKECEKIEIISTESGLKDITESLFCTDLRILRTISVLPQFLQVLELRSCRKLVSLPELPKTLKTLVCYYTGLASLPVLPECLTSLDVSSCYELESIPNLPRGLKIFLASNCRKLETIPPLQDLRLEKLCLPPGITSLPLLPDSLRSLTVQEFKGDRIDILPPNLQFLDCSYSPNLSSLPELPESLKDLTCASCISLKSIPPLPVFFKRLHCQGCVKIEAIPELWHRIETVYCKDCVNLKFIPKLRNNSACIAIDGCRCLLKVPEFLRISQEDCQGCPWLPMSKNFSENVEKLKKLQRFFRETPWKRRIKKACLLKRFPREISKIILNL